MIHVGSAFDASIYCVCLVRCVGPNVCLLTVSSNTDGTFRLLKATYRQALCRVEADPYPTDPHLGIRISFKHVPTFSKVGQCLVTILAAKKPTYKPLTWRGRLLGIPSHRPRQMRVYSLAFSGQLLTKHYPTS